MKFARLEAVRGFASLYVCVTHVCPRSGEVPLASLALSFGQEAVILFFVLSGFVISWATQKSGAPEPWRRYFLKRFARIYSVWSLAMVALVAIAWAEKGAYVPEPSARWLGNALMLQDYGAVKPTVICKPLYKDSPLWSLHYEWWFYMIYPLIKAFVRPEVRSHAVGGIAVVNAFAYALIPNPLSRVLMYLSIWWVGVHAAMTLRNNNKVLLADLRTPLAWVLATAIPGVIVTCATWAHGKSLSLGLHPCLEVRHLIATVVLVALAFLWRRVRWVGFGCLVGWSGVFAPFSYSLYIIHYRSISQASYLSCVGMPLVENTLYVILTLLFCWAAEVVFYPRVRSCLGI